MVSHAQYGTFLLGDGDWPRIVGHLDGHDAGNAKKFVLVNDTKLQTTNDGTTDINIQESQPVTS